jgi:hypothetical protein
LKEAKDGPQVALQYYQELLDADPSNEVCNLLLVLRAGFTETVLQKAIWARQISVLRKLGKTERAVEELSKFVDTFYTDVEAWLELADIYASQNQYAHSISHQPSSQFCILTPGSQIYLGSAGSIPCLGAHTTESILCATGWGNGVHSSGHPAGHEVLPHGYRDG